MNAFLRVSQYLSDICHGVVNDTNEGVEKAEEVEGNGDQGEGQQGEGQGDKLITKTIGNALLKHKLKVMPRKRLQVSKSYIRATLNEVLIISKV